MLFHQRPKNTEHNQRQRTNEDMPHTKSTCRQRDVREYGRRVGRDALNVRHGVITQRLRHDRRIRNHRRGSCGGNSHRSVRFIVLVMR